MVDLNRFEEFLSIWQS